MLKQFAVVAAVVLMVGVISGCSKQDASEGSDATVTTDTSVDY